MSAGLSQPPATERRAIRGGPPVGMEDPLADSALRALAYSDVFRFPLAAAEVHRYLVGVRADLAAVERTLQDLVSAGRLRVANGHFALPSRGPESDSTPREQFASACEREWRRTSRWGLAIARLPFVRMVAVTGALAADNPDGGDLDYFVVTVPGRLWFCRALIIQTVVRPARLVGDIVCPNYLLAADRLSLAARGLFAARELAQMVPLAGLDLYRRVRDANPWVSDLLPNAAGPPRRAATEEPRLAGRSLSRLVERGLAGRQGDLLERWEMRRKIRELERRHGARRSEVELNEGVCKGHYSEHGLRILAAWRERLHALGLSEGEVSPEPQRTAVEADSGGAR